MRVYEYIMRLKDQASDKLRRLSNSASSTDARFAGLNVRASRTSGVLGSLGTVAAAAARYIGPAVLGFALLSAGKQAVSLAADLQQTKVGFEVMLGSAEKATEMIGNIRAMSKVTPFETSHLLKASETLLGFGVAGERIMPTLKMLGDVARGDSERLRAVSLAFAQIQAAGRLMGQDLLQLVNAGFNPLQQISQETGKSLAVLKKEMEAGAISADMVSDAFKRATSEGGPFYKMMERMSKTFNGMVSTLRDEWAIILTTIGEKLLPHLIKGVQWLSSLLKDLTLTDFDPLIASFRDTFEAVDGVVSIFRELLTLMGVTTDQASVLQIAINGIALSYRIMLGPLRMMVTLWKLWYEAIAAGVNLLKAFGMILSGVMTGNIALIKTGIDQAKEALSTGLSDIGGTIKNFAKKEWEGFGGIFSKGKAQVTQGDWVGPLAPFAQKPDWLKDSASSGSSGSGVDSVTKGLDNISGGGSKPTNITINLKSLVGEQKFDVKNVKESVADMERQITEALLRVLNGANYAANQ